MSTLSQTPSMQQDCGCVKVSDLSYELEDVLDVFNCIGSEEALQDFSFLLDEYSRQRYDECAVGRASASVIRLCANISTIRGILKDIYKRFCEKGGEQ